MSSHSTSSKPILKTLFLVTAIVGLLIAAYSVKHQIDYDLSNGAGTNAACNISATLSCDSVAASPYSKIMGIPVGTFGVAFFLSALVLMLMHLLTSKRAYKTGKVDSHIAETFFWYFSLIGVAVSIIFGIISLFVLDSICPTCFGIYISTFIMAGLAFFIVPNKGIQNFTSQLGSPGLTAIIITVISGLVGSWVYNKSIGDQPPTQTSNSEKVYNVPFSKSVYDGAGEDYRKGNDQAKVVLVEFADFQCGACANLSSSLSEVYKEFGDKILVVFKNFPLSNKCNSKVNSDMHPFSCEAAMMARCAGSYGKFWPYHDKVFANQRRIDSANLAAWALEVGLSEDQINSCKESKDIMDKITADALLSNDVPITGTPTLFINGKVYKQNMNPESIKSYVSKLINE